jgi:two-component system response regulator FixJ
VIAVVDDDASVRRGLARLLRSAGYQAETYASSRDFLQQADFETPACLILDVRMPGQTGIELQEVLAAADSDLPIIFVTGHGDIPMAVRTIRAGAVDFLTKPFDDQELLDAIGRAITRPRRRSPPAASSAG